MVGTTYSGMPLALLASDHRILCMGLNQNLIPGTDAVYYIPEFISEEEERYLIRKIYETPDLKWKSLANRRLQVWGGELTKSNVLLSQALPKFVAEYPDLIGRIRATFSFEGSKHQQPNHILLNEYLPGQGIMPHEDGPSYYPTVATLSLGSHTIFNYYRYTNEPSQTGGDETAPSPKGPIDQEPVVSVLLEPRSLVITASSFYNSYLHGIEAVTEDVFSGGVGGSRIANAELIKNEEFRSVVWEGGKLTRDRRISLTFRDVERVLATKLQ